MIDYTEWQLMFDIGKCWLNYLKGCLLEIGVGKSTGVFIELSNLYGRRSLHCDIRDYGITFSSMSTFHNMTSDQMFSQIGHTPLALTLIDGNHSYEQVARDYRNTLNITEDNGLIFMHDTLPPNEGHLDPGLCGGVYRLRQELSLDETVDSFTFPFIGAPPNCGVTMVRKKAINLPYYQA